MGLLDKAKEKATHLAEQAKDKVDDLKDKRKVDDLLDDLGRIVYRQHTDRGAATDDAEIAQLVADLKVLEDEGAEVLPAVEKPADNSAATGSADTFAQPE
jgi:hypothetical protein